MADCKSQVADFKGINVVVAMTPTKVAKQHKVNRQLLANGVCNSVSVSPIDDIA